MEKFVNLLSKTCVSAPGLIFFNFLVFTINLKFLYRVTLYLTHQQKIDLEFFHDISSPLAVRLITVGVLILERHDVLEISGLVPKGSDHDRISHRTHPFGTFYLCFGLIMECLIEQIHMPEKFFDATNVISFVLWTSYIIAIISFLACLKLFYILLSDLRGEPGSGDASP
jgi:hypothetical protein